MRKVMKILIEDLLLHPTQILQSANTVEAIEKFLKDLEKSCNCNLNIKLVIVNLQMPVMDAFDFTKRIKSHQNP